MPYLEHLMALEKTEPSLAFLLEYIVERLDKILDKLEDEEDI